MHRSASALEIHLEASISPECSRARIYGCISLCPCYTAALWVALAPDRVLNAILVAGQYLQSTTWHRIRLLERLIIFSQEDLSAQHVPTERGRLQVLSFKSCHVVETRKQAFSMGAPAFWYYLPPPIYNRPPTLLVFRRALKIWLFPQALGVAEWESHSEVCFLLCWVAILLYSFFNV